MSHAAGSVLLIPGVASSQGILDLVVHVVAQGDDGATKHGHVQGREGSSLRLVALDHRPGAGEIHAVARVHRPVRQRLAQLPARREPSRVLPSDDHKTASSVAGPSTPGSARKSSKSYAARAQRVVAE